MVCYADMGKAIYTCSDKFHALQIQDELKQEGIETMISPGSAPGTTPTHIDPLTGLDSNWQIITHNEDAERAVNLLKERNTN